MRKADLIVGKVTDLSPLAKLTYLESLRLDCGKGARYVDVSPLDSLTNLKFMNLFTTPFSTEDLSSLQDTLPACEITWDEVKP